MNLPVLFAAEDPLSQVAETFGWHPQLFFSQVVLFVLLALILKKFAYAPLLAMLDKRQQQISESIENAEKTRKELANAQARSQDILKDAGVQANKIIEEARAAAAKISETESQRAVKAAEDIISKARQAAEADRDRLMAELKREVGHLAVKAAMQVTGKMLTAEDQQRLAEETNRQLAA